MSSTRIPVRGEAPYEVVVGRDLLGELPALVAGAEQAAVISSPPLRRYADRVAEVLAAAGVKPLLLDVPDTEKAKTLPVAEHLWGELGRSRLSRSDAIVGVGGGAVTDLAGFVAACWLRGVRVVQVPTTVLGMVDAAIGGKTAVNTAAGKNLVGAFHPPVGVLCDLAALETLPAEELIGGLAEVVKCGFIVDPAILDLIEADPAAAAEPAGPVLRELVERAVTVKAEVVSADLRETGRREILNYGHTLGHAIEKREAYRWRHGHAVAVGLVYAAALAREAGRLDRPTADRHGALLRSLRLPTTYAADAWPELRAAMRVDKKVRGRSLRFVVLDAAGAPGLLADPPDELLAAAYREVAR